MRAFQRAFFSFLTRDSVGAVLAGIFSLLFFSKHLYPLMSLTEITFLPLFLILWRAGERALGLSFLTALLGFLVLSNVINAFHYTTLYFLPVCLLGRLLKMTAPSKKPLKLPDLKHFETALVAFLMLWGGFSVAFLSWTFSTPPYGGLEGPFFAGQPVPTTDITGEALAIDSPLIFHFLPIFLTICWGTGLVTSLFLSRWILKHFLGRALFEFSAKRWSTFTWQYWVFVGVLAIVLLLPLGSPPQCIATNFLPLAILPFCIDGVVTLSIFYRRFRKSLRGFSFLIGGLVLLGWPLLFLGMLSIFEPWIRLRDRWTDRHTRGT